MKTLRLLPLAIAFLFSAACGGADALQSGFADPPEQTKPWCYWYWLNDHITKEGITHDLEAMARVGVGEALMANIFQPGYPAGNVKVLSEGWWDLVEHTIREGGRLGVDIGLFNCPGWSMSGGPWIKPEQSMRYLVSSEIEVAGPMHFEQKLPQPREHFQDVALIAFPKPEADGVSLSAMSPRVACIPPIPGSQKLADGNLEESLAVPVAARGAFAIEMETAAPFTARSLLIYPGDEAFGAHCTLEAMDEQGRFQLVRQFPFDRANMNQGLGPLSRGPAAISFAPTTSKKFRLTFGAVYFGRLRGSTLSSQAALKEIELSSSARLESFVEKQLGKMHATPIPLWDAYLWPPSLEPDSPGFAVATGKEINLSGKLSSDGTLHWDVPPGAWIILRTGMAPTGVKNNPASPEATGLEVDKMNRAAVRAHFDAFIGEVFRRMPASQRKALKHVVADSYEVGSENWTDGFDAVFRERYGYDPLPWLPVLTGRIVGSAEESERFLWDLRRLVADHISQDYVGGLRDLCHEHGLKLWLENYGHWGFAGEFLQYGGASDCVAGEFWTVKGLGAIEVRAASSCANTYGKPIASAEAFTSGPKFTMSPWGLKSLGDWAFSEGINHFVMQVYIHQPWDDRKPGVNAPWPIEFNRNNTWFEAGRVWVDYLRRSSFLLQQGNRVTDVAYFIGEDAPKMTGIRQPELPPGRDYDYINADIIQEKLTVKDGLLSLPHGTTYRVLALPEGAGMRPQLLRKIRDLVKAGATVLGPAPVGSPSLQNYPRCDQDIRKIAADMWGESRAAIEGDRRYGKGRVVWGKGLSEVLDSLGVGPDFVSEARLRFTHRKAGDNDIYFLANPASEAVVTTGRFRIRGKSPELWWPDSGQIEHPTVFKNVGGFVEMPLSLGPNGSAFVVFAKPQEPESEPIVSVALNGTTQLDARVVPPPESEALDAATAPTNNFSFAVWVKPGVDTTLVAETNRGIFTEPRDDVITPPHGSSFGDGPHAGCGLAVGRNGVVVFEDAKDCFAPVLVYSASLSDWTHVAVVYRDGQPSLYLNGSLVHKGLRSGFLVHPGEGNAAGVMPFRGEFGLCRQFNRSISDQEVAELAKLMPRPDLARSRGAIKVDRSASGGAESLVWQPGEYQFRAVSGKSGVIRVTSVPLPAELSGSWQVLFPASGGGPGELTFDELVDWTERPEQGVRYFSGTVTYRKTFVLSKPGKDRRLWLDLGRVRDMATIRLNGKSLGTLWCAPWRVDISDTVVAGENQLEVDVINTWNNRLVLDASLPPEKRVTFLLWPVVDKSAPLLPAGLLGPVTIQTAQRVVVTASQ